MIIDQRSHFILLIDSSYTMIYLVAIFPAAKYVLGL